MFGEPVLVRRAIVAEFVPVLLVVLVIGYPEYLLAHAVGEFLAHGKDEFGLFQVGMLGYELGHIDWLAYVHHEGVPQVIPVAILQSYGDNVNGFLFAKLLIRAQGDTEYTFAQWEQRVLGTVCTLWQYAEWYALLQRIDSAFNGLVVLEHLVGAIAHAADRHNLKECQNLSKHGLAENIGTCHKHFAFGIDRQHRQRILQRVGVIGSEDNGSIRRDILHAYIFEVAV